MGRYAAIVRATALEIACEPLALLITLTSLALATLAPALHCHQFGEPSRMAREAGLSAILVGSLAFAVFSAVRAVRRELESGTLQMVLAHSVSRGGYLLAKMAGVAVSCGVFFLTVWANSLTAVRGAELGAAAAKGDVARVWGPSLVLGVAPLVVPLVAAALLNRFARVRFVRAAMLLAFATAFAGAAFRFDAAFAARYFGVALLLAAPVGVFIALAASAAVRLKANAALALVFTVMALALPAFGSYYLPGVLAKGGAVSPGYVAGAFAAACPLAVAAAWAGMALFKELDLP